MAVAAATASLLKPAIAMGIIIGIYEIIILHRDVQATTHRFGHGVHALLFAIIACVINFHVPLFLSLVPAVKTIPFLGTELGVRIAVGIVMAVKIHGVSAAIKGSVGGASLGLKETWMHSLLIGALTVAAPYVWPFIAPVAPAWLK